MTCGPIIQPLLCIFRLFPESTPRVIIPPPGRDCYQFLNLPAGASRCGGSVKVPRRPGPARR